MAEEVQHQEKNVFEATATRHVREPERVHGHPEQLPGRNIDPAISQNFLAALLDCRNPLQRWAEIASPAP